MLLIIIQNVKNLLNLINDFLSSFLNELFIVLENENEKELDLSIFIEKVYYYSNELEKFRKKFLKKINKFNIRTTFEKLQNNNKNQKTKDLINSLHKKILNEDKSSFYRNSSSFLMMKTFDPEKGNRKGGKSNLFKPSKTINLLDKNRGSGFNPKTDKSDISKFFKKIKNDIKSTVIQKNKQINKNIKDKPNNNDDYKEKEYIFTSTSNEEEEEEEEEEDEENSKNNNNCLNNSKTFCPNKINAIIERNGNNLFAQNFIKQQTLFGSKFLKFEDKKENNESLYESSLLESLSPKKKNRKYKKKFN